LKRGLIELIVGKSDGGKSAVALQGRGTWQHCLILWERFSMKFGAANVRAITVVLVRTTSVVVVINFDD
jgi:hypothetical protein